MSKPKPKPKQRLLDSRNAARLERWFTEIWSSDEKFPISLNSEGPHGGPVWEWLGWSEKSKAWAKYQNSVPTDDYALLTDDGKFAQVGELSRGKGFDVLLTANGFDHCLLGAPGEHGQQFRQLFIDIKNKVWEARQERTRGQARRMKSGAQVVANALAEQEGRSPVEESVRGCYALFGESPSDMRVLAEAATGVKVECHSDALDTRTLGVEWMRLSRQVALNEPAWRAGQAVVREVSQAGWETEVRTGRKGHAYNVLVPGFDPGKAMTNRRARRLEGKTVVDMVAPARPQKPDCEQASLF